MRSKIAQFGSNFFIDKMSFSYIVCIIHLRAIELKRRKINWIRGCTNMNRSPKVLVWIPLAKLGELRHTTFWIWKTYCTSISILAISHCTKSYWDDSRLKKDKNQKKKKKTIYNIYVLSFQQLKWYQGSNLTWSSTHGH